MKAVRDSFSRNGRHYKKDRLLFKSPRGEVLEIINRPGVREGSETKPDGESALPSHSTRVKLKKWMQLHSFAGLLKVERPNRTDYKTTTIKGSTLSLLATRIKEKIHERPSSIIILKISYQSVGFALFTCYVKLGFNRSLESQANESPPPFILPLLGKTPTTWALSLKGLVLQ